MWTNTTNEYQGIPRILPHTSGLFLGHHPVHFIIDQNYTIYVTCFLFTMMFHCVYVGLKCLSYPHVVSQVNDKICE